MRWYPSSPRNGGVELDRLNAAAKQAVEKCSGELTGCYLN